MVAFASDDNACYSFQLVWPLLSITMHGVVRIEKEASSNKFRVCVSHHALGISDVKRSYRRCDNRHMTTTGPF